ncbi:hypothetical protein J1N35_014558 [Gossypium stocksii]|uniref:Putative plant transposon protein domain-containing protein n=1 Tax=Gossypium stocksii TaxID=47602 RepID=A0A9D3VUH4_9ROSI|nr:hypothetical protein J1N35_014558 [Gossypium stocksii]
MSCKRTRSSKTSPENSIMVQDKEAKESFMPISHSSTISVEQMLLLYVIMTKRTINVEEIILVKIHDCARKKAGSTYFPSLITSLCLTAQVKSKANLKGQYIQGCITALSLERLVENVHELNPIEPSIPI